MTGAGLAGASVLVTGAAGDIGAAFVAAFAAAGANVVAADVAGAGNGSPQAAADPHAGQVVAARCDVTSDEDLASALDLARAEHGGLDVLVNAAAAYGDLGPKRSLTELYPEEFDRVLRVNVRGTWQAIRAAVPALAASGGGRVVNVSSVVARLGTSGFAHYVASKAAVDGLTRAAAAELGEWGITVNAVAPGLVSDRATLAVNDPDYVARAAASRALRREMGPDDLVGAVLWLASPGAGFVTGQVIIVDGGGVFA